jgi:hypothetical protein
MGLLTTELRKIQMVVFDRLMRTSDNPDEARLLAEASKQIPKDRRVVLVESDLDYGNLRPLALDLNKVLDEDELLFLAYDQKGLDWAKSHNLSTAMFTAKSEPGSAKIWDELIRAKVSVYESHNWWRSRDKLLQRSLLEGSHKIQLWHGATGAVGKVFGLERLNSAKSFWHFTAVATSSIGFDELVNEPSQAEYRRTRSMISSKSILDVEYRLVQELNSGSWNPQEHRQILIAPTYSESTSGEDALVKWIGEVTKVATIRNWDVDIALHPGAKPRVAKLVKRISGNARLLSGVSASELRKYSAVVTDFSGIAHDSLMLGIPTVSVLIDFDNYQEICPSIIDEAQMQVAYVVREPSELETKLSLAVESDWLASTRENYATSVVSGIGALPGVNTREAVMDALNKDS